MRTQRGPGPTSIWYQNLLLASLALCLLCRLLSLDHGSFPLTALLEEALEGPLLRGSFTLPLLLQVQLPSNRALSFPVFPAGAYKGTRHQH